MRKGRVYQHEREAAARREADQMFAVRVGTATAQRIAAKAQAAAIRAYKRGRNPKKAAFVVLADYVDTLTQVGLYSWLRGLERASKEAPGSKAESRQPALSLSGTSPSYTRNIQFLRRRLKIPIDVLERVEDKLQAQALVIVRGMEAGVEKQIQQAIISIARQNLHVRDGVKVLREAFGKAGISPTNKFQLENIFRTQTQIGYAAGNREYAKQPHIKSILWGYKYVAVGDSRTRPTHMAMDGVTLPKEHPFWETHYPPNGYSCRCQAIPLYRPRAIVEPPASITVKLKNGGKVKAKPEPDDGFSFDPGEIV